MNVPKLLAPLLALAALAVAIFSQGKTWPMVLSQCLLAGSWLLVRTRAAGITGGVPFWVVPVGVAVIFATISVPSAADESAYRFQARVFGSGRLAAPAPAGKTLVNNNHKNEFFLVHTVQREGKWFVQYVPGWPAVLAIPEKFGLGRFVNPLFAVLLLWLTWKIAARLDGPETARRALFFLVLSPMFLLNFSGYYSHGVVIVLVAAATWLAIVDTGAGWLRPAGILAAIAVVSLARPYDALVCAIPLMVMVLWKRRTRPMAIAGCIGMAVVAAGVATGAQAYYNFAQAGNPWKSLYAVYRGSDELAKMLQVSPGAIWANLRVLAMRSVVKTAASMFAFPMLLWAAWTAVRSRRLEYLLLGFLVALIPLAYLIMAEQSDTVIGERYYLGTIFALAILAAAGSSGPVPRWLVACSVLTAAVGTFWFSGIQHQRWAPFAAVEALALTRTDPAEVIFLASAPDSTFAPTDTNMNYPDWPSARPLSMPDPGPARRNAIACQLGRRVWTVITPPGLGTPASISPPESANCP